MLVPTVRRPRLRRPRGAFTLVELMVVIAIIGLLASVVTVAVMGRMSKARRTKVAADMSAIRDAIDHFKIDTGRYPRQLNELWERPADARGWGPDPYLREYPPRDPWGAEYVYQYVSGSNFEIISYGAGGAPGGVEEEADLSSKTINNQEQ